MHDRQSLGNYLITEHIRELQDDADRQRLGRELASERTRSMWRQQTGNVARRLSVRPDLLEESTLDEIGDSSGRSPQAIHKLAESFRTTTGLAP